MKYGSPIGVGDDRKKALVILAAPKFLMSDNEYKNGSALGVPGI